MNFQDVIGIVESAIYQAKGRKLTDPELAVLRGSWEGLTYEEMAEGSPYRPNYLKGDVSHKFWKLLTEALGEQVSKRNFRAALIRAAASGRLHTQPLEERLDEATQTAEKSSRSTLTKFPSEVTLYNSRANQPSGANQPFLLSAQTSEGIPHFVEPMIESQPPPESSDLEKRMRDWFEALGYELRPEGRRQTDYFELIIHIPQRQGYARILVRGVEGEADLNDLSHLCQSIKDYQPNEGWLVAARRISPAVRDEISGYRKQRQLKSLNSSVSTAIEEYRKQRELELLCYTFDELLDQDANFTNYFNWLHEEVTRQGINDDTYVPLACIKKEESTTIYSSYAEKEGWIDGYIDRWLDDPDKKHISILGEFGTGKTWFAFHYAWTALKRYQDAKDRGIHRPRLPLLIPLRDYTKALNLENVLAGFFYSKHNIRLTSLVFKQLNSMGKLLLIFDGFDEMAAKVDHQKMIDNFWELAKVVETGAKVILTCRTEYFPKADDGRALLNAELPASTMNVKGIPPQFEVLELKKLNDAQIRKVLSLHLRHEFPEIREALLEKILSNPKLRDLARRPVMIDFILEALPDIEAGKQFDLSRTYLYAVRRKMERDIREERTFTSLADKLYFLCELSWEMLASDQMQLHYRDFPDRIRRLFGPVVQRQIELDHWRYDMMSQSMLTRNADGEYAPAHRSLLEFFTAYKFAAELGVLASDFTELARAQSNLDSKAAPKPYSWSAYFQRHVDEHGKPRLVPALQDFSSEPLEVLRNTFGHRKLTKAVLDLLEHMLAPKETTVDRLFNLIEATRGKTPAEIGYLGGNAVSLLLRTEPTALEGKDLSHTVVQGADFTYAASLRNTNLTGANLRDSLFTQTFGSILSVAFSKDVLAIGSSNGEICLLQLKDGQKYWSCEKHAHWVRSIAFHPSRPMFASGSDDQTVKIWEINADGTGKCIRTLEGHENCVRSVAFSEDGRWLASGSEDETIRIWNIETGQCERKLEKCGTKVLSVAFSPINSSGIDRQLASGSADGIVRIWNIKTGECLHEFKENEYWIRSVTFSPDGQMLASGSDDQTITIWHLNANQSIKLSGHDHWIRAVAFSSNGRQLVSGSDDQTVRTWDTRTGQCLSILYGHENRVWSVAFSHDDQWIASGSDDQTVRTWDVETGQCVSTLQGHSNWILAVAFRPDGKKLASGCEDKNVRIWDLQTHECRTLTGHTNRIWSVAFSPDGQLLASGSDDQTIRIWDLKTGTNQCLNILKEHDHWVRSVAFSPDGQLLASGSDDRTVRIWNVQTGDCLTTLEGHKHWVRSVTFSSDGRWLASGSDDRTVRIWNVQTFLEHRTLQHENWVRSVAFSPDGRLLASGSDDEMVWIWNIETGKCLKTLRGHESWVHSVIFSPDGKRLVSSSQEATKLWNVSDGKLLQSFQERADDVLSDGILPIALSPDGTLIAGGRQDETIQLRSIKTGQCKSPLRIPKPYEGMSITDTTGLMDFQQQSLKTLGAI